MSITYNPRKIYDLLCRSEYLIYCLEVDCQCTADEIEALHKDLGEMIEEMDRIGIVDLMERDLNEYGLEADE